MSDTVDVLARDFGFRSAVAILDRAARPMQAHGHQIVTGFSIGIAIGPDDNNDPGQLLNNADLALDRAKRDERSVFHFFEVSLDAAARKRRQLRLDLREALKAGQFRLDF